jgi:hypothetical protein
LTNYRWSRATDQKEWDDFVLQNGGSVCQSWTWKLYLEDSGNSTVYVICRNGRGDIVAACPFAVIRKGKTACVLESLPFTSAGPIVNSEVEDYASLLTSLSKFHTFSPLMPLPISMTIRTDQPGIYKPMSDLGWKYVIHQGDFRLDFQETTPQTIWNQVFRKDERNELRFYQRAGFSFHLAENEGDYDAFIELYRESMARRGYGERVRQISSMRNCFKDSFGVCLLESEGRLVAGISFLCNEKESTVRLDKIGYAPIKNSRSPYFFMLWMMVNWACEKRYRFLRLGTTSADEKHPLHHIKRKFGGTFIPEYDFRVPISSRSLSALRSLNRLGSHLRRE